MATAALNRYTPEEYLALERHAEFRSEYIDGRIIAMTGGSITHNYIVGNIYAGLLARFAARPCHVFFADVKVRFGWGTNYTYPDVMALCGRPARGDEHADVLTNPALIVEVLSRSTQAYDRGEKFERYKAIETLREYVLIAQDEVLVEHFEREGDFWRCTAITDLNAVIDFQSVACSFPIREIYRRTDFVVEDVLEAPE
ncbi:Uma2 family endonuclease [Longimicrobium sp.]|uniref:Uma2 family endonuclease n=1 Tax=Longimicrobium sp. TaxID=2029185 RepID=UPI003B3A5D64